MSLRVWDFILLELELAGWVICRWFEYWGLGRLACLILFRAEGEFL